MNIASVTYKYSYKTGAGLTRPSFSGFAKQKTNGGELSHEPGRQSKYKNYLENAGFIASMMFAGVSIGSYYIQDYKLKSEYNMVVSERSSFETRKDALKYAKKKVIDALKESSPYEYNVIIDNNNNIVGEFKGDSTEVKSFYRMTDLLKGVFLGYSITSIHGHPDNTGQNITTPISFSDFRSLVTIPIEKESIVFNKRGEYSILKKTDRFVSLEEELIEFFRYVYNEMLIDGFNKKNPEKLVKRESDKNFCNSNREKERIDKAYYEEVTQFSQTIDGIKIIDAFWREYASKLGLEYKTNYSCLQNVKNFEDNP